MEQIGILLSFVSMRLNLLLSLPLKAFLSMSPAALASIPLLDFWQYNFMRNALLAVLLIAPIFGLAGTLVVDNRLSFYSDALGHSALTGIAIGTILGLQDPIISMLMFAVIFGLGISAVKNRARSSTDTIIGVFSSSAVALGIALLSREGGFAKYNRYLVGDILAIQSSDIILIAATLVLISVFYLLFYNRLLVVSVNRSLAISKGIPARVLENMYLVVIAVLVTVAIKWVGILLINSLLILPASAARNVARSMRQYHALSLIFSFISCISGLLLSFYFDTAAGATIVLVSAVIFALTFGLSRIKNN